MKRRFRFFTYGLMMAYALFFLGSCGLVQENSLCDEPNVGEESRATLILRIGQLTPSVQTRADGATNEIMQTLRVIILDDSDILEFNRMYDFSADNGVAEYVLQIDTDPGEKKIFFIANEKSVGYGIENEINGTTDWESDDFSSFLNSLSGSNVAEKLNSVVFTLSPEQALPLTSFYEVNLIEGSQDKVFYLVPAATKYTVNFTNHREDEVQIKSVAIISTANRNYLMPRVGASDYYKGGEYWIEWLKEVSDESHSHLSYEDNKQFNEERSWIFNYSLPLGTSYGEGFLFKSPSGNEDVKVPVMPDEADDETIKNNIRTINYYLPESKNLIDKNNPLGEQAYHLQVEVWDPDTEGYITLSRSLPNVKALFRNTHVIIDVVMGMGYLEVYAEIIPWSVDSTVYGYVVREEE